MQILRTEREDLHGVGEGEGVCSLVGSDSGLLFDGGGI